MFFDGALHKSCLLNPDGRLIPAAYHEKGDRGFIVGVFDGGQRHETEVTDAYLKDGVVIGPEPDIGKKAPQMAAKRPAAQAAHCKNGPKVPKSSSADKSVDECDNPEEDAKEEDDKKEEEYATEEEATEEDEQDEDIKPLAMVLVRCHGLGTWGVHLKTSGKDRAQIVEFWGAREGDELFGALARRSQRSSSRRSARSRGGAANSSITTSEGATRRTPALGSGRPLRDVPWSLTRVGVAGSQHMPEQQKGKTN